MTWNVLRSAPSREATAAERLLDLGFEHYLPLMPSVVRHGALRQRSFTSRPIFPQYLFVRAGHDRWREALDASGIIGLLRAAGSDSPATVTDSAIDEIRRLELALAVIPSRKRVFSVGDKVRYVRRYFPFDGMAGILKRIDKRDRAVIEMILPTGSAVARLDTGIQWLRAV